MAIGSTLEGQLLNMLLAGKTIANISATAGATVTWCALHTADPSSGTGQNQTEVSSATFPAYARTSVDRSTGGWTVTGSGPATASPVATIGFPQLTSTSTGTASFWSVGTSSSGAGQIIASGTLTPNIQLGQNVTPQVTTGSSVTLN
jgi:hypothetical protein